MKTGILLVCMIGAALAATEIYSPPVNKHAIFLHNEVIDTKNANAYHFSTHHGDDSDRVYLIQLTKNCKHFMASVEEEFKIKFFGYIPENTYMAYCSPSTAAALRQKEGIQFVGELSSHNKVSTNLEVPYVASSVSSTSPVAGLAPRTNKRYDTETLTVKVAVGADAEEVSKALKLVTGVKHSQKVSDTLVSAVVSSSSLKDIAEAIAKVKSVVYVERVARTRVHNRYSQGILQSGKDDSRPLVDAGLSGDGEVVGVGDTGVDIYRCAFNDDKKDVTFTKDPEKDLKDNGHRKIKGYWALMDDLDYPNGHGTHVSGSILGGVDPKKSAELAKYNGGAEKARVVMTDIGCIADGGCPCTNPKYCPAYCVQEGKCPAHPAATFTPPDLNEGYFPWSYEAGARIHSNSWGEGSEEVGFGGQYSESSAQIDEFVHEHEDFLILFAAGNEGKQGFYSIGSQGMAKNVLTVGATMTSNNGFMDSVEYADYQGIIDQINDVVKQSGMSDSLDGPDDCCDPDIEKKHQGVCMVASQLVGECTNLAKLCCPKVASEMKKQQYKQEILFNESNMAAFSSLGGGRDGRVKPDILSPGQSIISVRSQGTINKKQCGDPEKSSPNDALLEMSGTSMATPNLAGQAALVREYYRKGFFPSGAASSADALSPSAALLKATIINSGRSLEGVMEATGGYYPLTVGSIPSVSPPNAIPSNIQGFGRPILEKTLPLKLSGHKSANMILASDHGNGKTYKDPQVDDGEKFNRCFEVLGDDEHLKVTMVYTDPPAQPNSGKVLVNNLDLFVARKEDRAIFAGNQRSMVNPKTGATVDVSDTVNNVEQVTIEEPQRGIYMARVQGTHVPKGPQKFALVISGNAKAVSCSSQTPTIETSAAGVHSVAGHREPGADFFLYALGGVGVCVVAVAAVAVGIAYVHRSKRQPTAYSRADALLG